MNLLKLFSILFLSIISSSAFAQEKKYYISAPTDLKEEGWNKVLCMKNGNTMLFHFEPNKRIIVKVFDTTHKEIASIKESCKLLDILTIRDTSFRGVYDINDEGVLFFDQGNSGKHELVRLRFHSANGNLIEEALVAESKSLDKRMRFYVMKNKDNDNYEILFCTDKQHPKESDIFIAYFNSKHESIKDIQLEVDRKKFDYLHVLGAESLPNGILVTLGVDKKLTYGRQDEATALKVGGTIYEHYLSFYYIPKDSATPKTALIDLTAAVFPFYAIYTYNSFARSLNLLLFSYKPLFSQFGLNRMAGKVSSSLFFKVDEQDFTIGYSKIKNQIASDLLKQHTDTFNFFDGIPIKMFTNENGLSTLISQSVTRFGEQETRITYNLEDYIGNIGITQFDDDGNELWGTVLPLAQYFKSYKHHYSIKEMAKRWQEQEVFGDEPPRVYNRQFVSVNAYSHDKNFYIIYNDYDKNFNNSLSKPGDTVYSFDITNACYYKINSKKEITKNYLFGKSSANEYKTSFIEGADFDEQRGIYAALVQYRKNDKVTLCMAWRRLD